MLIAGLYFATSFLGAFLLFGVQPMIAKFLLPTLGGTPLVWNLCMVFFQTALLLGYLYAHVSTKFLNTRQQGLVHVVFFALIAVLLPISLRLDATSIDPTRHPILWEVMMLAICVGAPFFVLSATSPLLQRWVGSARHGISQNPYVLFASSNLGSLVALLGYPFFIEPNFGIARQSTLLQYGIFLQIALMAACAVYTWVKPAIADPTDTTTDAPKPTRDDIGKWMLYAAIPSSILYGVTSFITTDIASLPLLWVLPLALYLLTFVIVFLSPNNLAPTFVNLHIPAALVLLWMIDYGNLGDAGLIKGHLICGFIIMMACHARLSWAKPAKQYLTLYYLAMSAGGILGGVFNTLLAPLLFNSIAEYPLAVILSLAVFVPWRKVQQLQWEKLFSVRHAVIIGTGMLIIILLLIPFWVAQFLRNMFTIEDYIFYISALILLTVTAFAALRLKNALLMGVAMAVLFAGFGIFRAQRFNQGVIFKDRNYYAVHRVSRDGNSTSYSHGSTMHGFQPMAADKRLELTSYYPPVKEILGILESGAAGSPIALLGMGTATSLCAAKPGQIVDIYEIDTLVVRLSQQYRFFTYLTECPAKPQIIMGDGRLNLARADDGRYGLMIMDAFTSDAIPIHLLTREAIAIYKQKLAEGGLIAFNISNRHLDLKPVVAAVAAANGMTAYQKTFSPKDKKDLGTGSTWAILSAQPLPPPKLDKWQELRKADASYLWTDDYSNIMRVLQLR